MNEWSRFRKAANISIFSYSIWVRKIFCNLNSKKKKVCRLVYVEFVFCLVIFTWLIFYFKFVAGKTTIRLLRAQAGGQLNLQHRFNALIIMFRAGIQLCVGQSDMTFDIASAVNGPEEIRLFFFRAFMNFFNLYEHTKENLKAHSFVITLCQNARPLFD